MANVTSNLKDTLSTIFGIIGAITGGIVVAAQSGLVLPTIVLTIAGSLAAISVAIIGFLTGKAPNATVKAPEVVAEQNVTNEAAKEVKP